MKYKLTLISIITLFLAIDVIIFGILLIKNKTSISEKDSNTCVKNDDCKYIWFTGVCNTSEYTAKTQKEAGEQGIRIGEAPPRENVTCTCEFNKCVTHN